MRPAARYLLLAILIAGIIGALALFVHDPLLYTIEQDHFPSRFHMNVDTLKHTSHNTTTDLVPDLQEFVDFTGPVSLNIHIRDVEQARREFERFSKSHGSIKNLVLKLDMSESEIQELEQNTALQKEILDTLLNTSISLEELQVMEIQYHSQGNQDMLTTVRLRGEELRKKVRGMDARYRNVSDKVETLGKRLGLNMTKNQESELYVSEIVQEIVQPKATPLLEVDTTLIPGEDRVSLFLRPTQGRYRDVIEYMGISLSLRGNTTIRTKEKPIVLYMDDKAMATAVTDNFGFYDIRIPIERIEAGNHTVYARSPTSRSVNRVLDVIEVGSRTNLTVEKFSGNATVNCSGTVMANYPVRYASVEIAVDNTQVIVTRTDSQGFFMRDIELAPGRHTLIARFSGSGYPIRPSESEPVVVTISLVKGIEIEPELIGILIAAIAILIVSGVATRYYLQRMTRKIARVAEIVPVAEEAPPAEPEAGPEVDELLQREDESLLAYYTRILEERGLSAASGTVYQQLARRVARDLQIKRYRSLTPREMSRSCKGKTYCSTFARFIAIYERVRYGGTTSVKDQSVFETAVQMTDEQTGGEDH